MRRRLLLAIGVLGSAASCVSVSGGPTVPVARLSGPYRVMVYKGGTPDFEGPIAPGSAEEKEIAAWLQAHDTGWGIDFNTYAPSRRVEGRNFDLNFTGNLCVLNYDANGKGRCGQVSRAIGADVVPAVFARPKAT